MMRLLSAACALAAAAALPAPASASAWDMAMVAGNGYYNRELCVDAAREGMRTYERTTRPIGTFNTSSSSAVDAYEIGDRNGLDAMAICISRPTGGYDMALIVYADDGRESEAGPVLDRLLDIMQA